MRIKLKWVNRNNRPVVTNIYRNETDVPNDQLGTAIGSVPDGTTEFIDDTAVFGKTYYYVFATVGGGQTLYSRSLKIVAQYTNGPGPQTLISGDQGLGYFGSINAIDFFSQQEIVAVMGLSYSGSTPLPVWDKWIRNGKILYVPRCVIYPTISYGYLYSKGVVFGTNDNGPAWASAATTGVPTNQFKTVEKGYFRFIVRCPTGYDDRNNPTRVVPDAATPGDRKFSEIADIFYPALNTWVPETQRFPRTGSASPLATINESRDIFCQEKFKTGVASGFNGSNNTSGYAQGIFNPLPATSNYGWRPVLELIQEDFVIGSTVL